MTWVGDAKEGESYMLTPLEGFKQGDLIYFCSDGTAKAVRITSIDPVGVTITVDGWVEPWYARLWHALTRKRLWFWQCDHEPISCNEIYSCNCGIHCRKCFKKLG